jgi:hypothetical protein
MSEAKAPFVVLENPRMHALAQDLVGGRKPSQIVQPYEHGTGHQKATGLYLPDNLPKLKPTCLMEERVSAMADLSRSPHREALRSRTYVGIAADMALQWMPTVMEYCGNNPTRAHTVSDMVAAARRALATIVATTMPIATAQHASDADPRPVPVQLGGGSDLSAQGSLELLLAAGLAPTATAAGL